MGRVEEAYADQDGLVRKVRLLMSDSSLNHKGERVKTRTVLERPIHKLVLLLKNQQTELQD
jgi:hypothetical protein